MAYMKRPGFPREEDKSVQSDPPYDGKYYARRDGEWAEVTGLPTVGGLQELNALSEFDTPAEKSQARTNLGLEVIDLGTFN